MAQMPEEGRKFGIVDSIWRDIMTESVKDTHCLVATDQPNMLGRLREANVLLEEIQKGLNAYLEKKRLYFPRYAFINGDGDSLFTLSMYHVTENITKCHQKFNSKFCLFHFSFTRGLKIIGLKKKQTSISVALYLSVFSLSYYTVPQTNQCLFCNLLSQYICYSIQRIKIVASILHQLHVDNL